MVWNPLQPAFVIYVDWLLAWSWELFGGISERLCPELSWVGVVALTLYEPPQWAYIIICASHLEHVLAQPFYPERASQLKMHHFRSLYSIAGKLTFFWWWLINNTNCGVPVPNRLSIILIPWSWNWGLSPLTDVWHSAMPSAFHRSESIPR